MLDHYGIPCGDVDASVAFYLRAFAPLGFTEAMRFPDGEGGWVVGLAGTSSTPTRPQPQFWLTSGGPVGCELHCAFAASGRDAVDAVHAAALDAGIEVLHAPAEWPQYHPGYYAVFLRDPDGHNVEAVHHGFPG